MASRKTKRRRPARRSPSKSEVSDNLNIRCLIEEKQILIRIANELIARIPHLNRSDVIKELIGMTRTGFITPEIRDRIFHECERARKEERDRKEKRDRKRLPPADNDKTGYIHQGTETTELLYAAVVNERSFSLPGERQPHPFHVVHPDEEDDA